VPDPNPYFGGKNKELSDRMSTRNSEALARVLFSDEGNPLVDYEWMALDFVQYQLATGDVDEIDILKRSVAHTLRYGDDKQVMQVLRHMGAVHLESGEVSDGCRVFGELIASDPLDFENYLDVSLLLHNLKHYDLSLQVATRAHHMLRISRSSNDMANQLAFTPQMTRRQMDSDEAVIDKPAEKPLRKALETGFMRGTHLPIHELAARIIPEIDDIPVKEIPCF
jgi:hypothetical protein